MNQRGNPIEERSVKNEIRVLLADDSPTMRRALTTLLSQDPRLEVVGTARDGEEVLQMARHLKPDVISMDVQMPRLDGLEATRRIMADCPCRIVVVSSFTEDAEMNLSFNAMQAGALELFGKPQGGSPADLAAWGRKLSDLLARVSEMPLSLSIRSASTEAPALPTPKSQVEIVGLAASTGGPPVLAELLEKLPPDLPVPLLVAQHMTEGFTGGFRRWLGQISPLPVEVALDGIPPQAGHVYLAPDGCHLEVAAGRLKTPRRSDEGACPSADRLLKSLAKGYGAKAAGVVLTGMGEDGGKGLLEIKQAGGVTLAQDEASCVVYGMPKFAKDLGAVQQNLTPEQIAFVLRRFGVKGVKAANER